MSWILLLGIAAPGGSSREIVHRSDLAEEETARIQQFLSAHDEAFVRGDYASLRRFYAPGFFTPGLVATREEMVKQWEALQQRYGDITFYTKVLRIDRIGSYYAVSGCRPFQGTRRGETEARWDDFCSSIILRLQADHSLEIVNVLEIDHDKLSRFLDEEGVYRASSLAYELSYPAGFFPVPLQDGGAVLDDVLFLDPQREAWIRVRLLEPTLPLPLERALARDLHPGTDPRVLWLREPAACTGPSGLRAAAAEAVHPCATISDLPEDLVESAVYVAPDDATLFCFTLKAPRAALEECRASLTSLVQSLKLLRSGDQDYAAVLQELRPGWEMPEEGVFRHPRIPLRLTVPEGTVGTPLGGKSVQRLRLDLVADPGSHLLVLVYDPGTRSLEQLVEEAGDQIRKVWCSNGDSVVSSSEHLANVLGVSARERDLVVQRDSGVKVRHRILAVTREGFRILVQLVPGSDDDDAQDRALQATLASLHWDG